MVVVVSTNERYIFIRPQINSNKSQQVNKRDGAQGFRHALKRAAIDSLLSLPVAEEPDTSWALPCTGGVAVFSSSYVLSTVVGYSTITSPSVLISTLVPGFISTSMELCTRPLLTGHRPTAVAAQLVLCREVLYWGGLHHTHGLLLRDEAALAYANQIAFVCGFCNALDVLLAKSIDSRTTRERPPPGWRRAAPMPFGRLMCSAPRLVRDAGRDCHDQHPSASCVK